MKFIDILATANQSLFRNKVRTLLTVIAIFIGATTLSLTNGIGSGIKSYLNRQVGDLGNSNSLIITAANKKANLRSTSDGLQKYTPGEKEINSTGPGPSAAEVVLTGSDIKKIEAQPNIVSVQPSLSIAPDYIASAEMPNEKYQFSLNQTVGQSSLDMSNGNRVNNNASDYQLTIPTSYASSLGFSNSEAVDKQVTIGITNALGQQSNVTATIVGVQQKTLVGSTAAYADNALFGELYNIQTTGLPASTKDAYTSLTAVFKSNLTPAQIQNLKNNLSGEGYDAETVKDEVSTVFTIISAVTDVFDGFAAITLLAAAFGIVNTLYMSVSERTKEIGLMKALGMSKAKIFTLFSIEAALIGFWGSLLGVGFANIIGRLVNMVASKGFLKDFTIIIGIMLIAFLAGTLPARRASQKDPIEALRYE
jgi:putative ABC transport system permease protein